MDPTTATQTNAFLDWFQTDGQVLYIIIQMLYWIVVAGAAAFAAWQAKRWVDYTSGKTQAKADAKAQVAEATGTAGDSDDVAVEEFVD
jgi:aminopeptidase N